MPASRRIYRLLYNAVFALSQAPFFQGFALWPWPEEERFTRQITHPPSQLRGWLGFFTFTITTPDVRTTALAIGASHRLRNVHHLLGPPHPVWRLLAMAPADWIDVPLVDKRLLSCNIRRYAGGAEATHLHATAPPGCAMVAEGSALLPDVLQPGLTDTRDCGLA